MRATGGTSGGLSHYSCRMINGMMPAKGGPASLPIDWIGGGFRGPGVF